MVTEQYENQTCFRSSKRQLTKHSQHQYVKFKPLTENKTDRQ